MFGLLKTKPFLGIFLVVVFVGGFFLWKTYKNSPEEIFVEESSTTETQSFSREIIGKSVEGRNIEAYTFGKGEIKILFIGGIHGGYEWNTVLLANNMVNYFKSNTEELIPENLSVLIVPSLNPDGIYKVVQKEGEFTAQDVPTGKGVTDSGRFNANNVDLNRNFACRWKSEGTWRGQITNAGTSEFSEPEAIAIRDFILKEKPAAVVSWHSQANTVYPGECGNGINSETLEIMNLYATAANYLTSTTFSAYEVTGDLGDWLSTIGIPGLTVELETHENIDWERNLAGVKSLLNYYSKK